MILWITYILPVRDCILAKYALVLDLRIAASIVKMAQGVDCTIMAYVYYIMTLISIT